MLQLVVMASIVGGCSHGLFIPSGQNDLDRGDRIRITTMVDQTEDVLIAQFDYLGADGVLYVDDPLSAIPVSSILQLEVSDGRSSSVRRGALIGLLGGAAAGAIFGYAQGDDEPGAFLAFSAEEKAYVGALLGAGPGALLGAVVGALVTRERWRKVGMEKIQISTPQR